MKTEIQSFQGLSGTIPETNQDRSLRTGWNSVYFRNYLYCCLLLSEAVDLSLGAARGWDTNPFSGEESVGLAVEQQCERKKSLGLGRKCWVRQRTDLEALPSLQENGCVELEPQALLPAYSFCLVLPSWSRASPSPGIMDRKTELLL